MGTLSLGFLVSLGALAALAKLHARNSLQAAALILILISTRAFVDYATSGLENPLTHLLLALHLWIFFQELSSRRLLLLGLLSSLLALNRMDAILLVLPLTMKASVQEIRRTKKPLSVAKTLLVAALPFLLWEAFSLFYYGSLVPNTALAKLNTGIAQADLIQQGLLYFLDALVRDPLTVIVITVACASGFTVEGRKFWPISTGILVHLIYVVSIGGDFMSGRFLSAPLFASALLLTRLLPPKPVHSAVLAACGLLLGLGASRPTFLFDGTDLPEKNDAKSERGITDEQAFWYPESGLLNLSRARSLPVTHHRTNGETSKAGVAAEVGAAGFRGFFSPPNVFLLDHNALVDPLLSRLPAKRKAWRPGHFRRRIPIGYPETLVGTRLRLKDPGVNKLYKDVLLVTRGDLFAQGRLAAILRLNTGQSASEITAHYK